MAEGSAPPPKTIDLGLSRLAERKPAPDKSVADLVGRIDEVLAFLKERPSQHPPELPTSFGGVEARIAHLEASTAHLQRDVAQMRIDLRDIRERVPKLQERAAHLPGRGMLAISVLALIVAIGAASAFQQQLQAFLAAAFS